MARVWQFLPVTGEFEEYDSTQVNEDDTRTVSAVKATTTGVKNYPGVAAVGEETKGIITCPTIMAALRQRTGPFVVYMEAAGKRRVDLTVCNSVEVLASVDAMDLLQQEAVDRIGSLKTYLAGGVPPEPFPAPLQDALDAKVTFLAGAQAQGDIDALEAVLVESNKMEYVQYKNTIIMACRPDVRGAMYSIGWISSYLRDVGAEAKGTEETRMNGLMTTLLGL